MEGLLLFQFNGGMLIQKRAAAGGARETRAQTPRQTPFEIGLVAQRHHMRGSEMDRLPMSRWLRRGWGCGAKLMCMGHASHMNTTKGRIHCARKNKINILGDF